jgi:hypothetical protein
MPHCRFLPMLLDWDLRRVLWGRVLLLELRLWLDFGVLRAGRLRRQANVLEYISVKVDICRLVLLTSK